jgi:phenylacetate-CoA ligase
VKGELIHGEFFTHLFYGRNDVRQFQIHQTSLKLLTVRYVAAAASAHDFVAQIAAAIRGRMGEGTEVCVEACDAIPVPPSGKHRFTISDVPFCTPRSNGDS